MYNDDGWLSFAASGKVEDYLKYKNEVKLQTDEHTDKGACNQGTDNRGE